MILFFAAAAQQRSPQSHSLQKLISVFAAAGQHHSPKSHPLQQLISFFAATSQNIGESSVLEQSEEQYEQINSPEWFSE